MASPNGTQRWGPRARSPFAVINYPHDLRQAAHQAQARRQINIGDANGPDYSGPGPDCTGPDPPHDFCGSDWCGPDPPWSEESYEDDEEITPHERKDKQYAHCNFRTGYLADLINDEWDRKVFVDERYVVHQQSSAHDMDPHHAANRRTPEFGAAAPVPLGQTEPRREAGPREGPLSTSDTGAAEVIMGAYGDWPLDITAGVVAPYPRYIVIDGGDGHLQPAGGRHRTAQVFQGWYGDCGAEWNMRARSTARCFPHIRGMDPPAERAERMEEDLRRQSHLRQTREEMQERYDQWGYLDEKSMFKEAGDSTETKYDCDMYVATKMANRWKEIHYWQIDKRCWDATYGPNTQSWAYLRESKDRNGKSWPEWMGEESLFHPDNQAREDASRELERDITIPDYTELVEAVVGQRVSIAAETIMAHLSKCIVLSHARLKAEQRSVGESSLPKEIKEADDYVNRVSDQIEMLQYVRGRIGEDRDTVLDICARNPCHAGTRFPTPVPAANPPLDQTEPRLEMELTTADNVMTVETAISMQRPVSDRDSPLFSPLSEDDEPGKPAPKRWSPMEPGEPGLLKEPASKRSPGYSPVTDDDEHPELKRLKQRENVTTVINSESFTPMTPPTEERIFII